MKNLLHNYVSYNYWANDQMAGFMSTLSPEEFTASIPNSFPSLKLTVLHIWDAEYIWMERLKGNSPDFFPSDDLTIDTDKDTIINDWLEGSKAFEELVLGFSKEDLKKRCNYTNAKGTSYSQPIYEIVHHIMNHSTYHRGQLTMMFRHLELKNIPSTDMIFYFREKG